MDYQISFYFDPDGSFWQEVNGRRLRLNPWIGIQMESWLEKPRDWTRKKLEVYEPLDLNEHLRKIEESKSMKPIRD